MSDERTGGQAGDKGTPRTVTSKELLQDRVEILIDHGSVIYRLRKTSTGKLILTK